MSNRLHIIHLDDHSLFRDGMKMTIDVYYPDADFKNFIGSQPALNYLEECHDNKKQIDFIITDYNHLGDNGLVFAEKVRLLEKKYSVRTPILLFTMVIKNTEFQMALEDKIIDKYFSKASTQEQIINFIKEFPLE